MGRRGPRPTPTTTLRLRGSWRADARKSEPKPKLGAPPMPSWLSLEAKAEWKRVVPELKRLGLLTQLDRAALSLYCVAYGRWATAEKELAVLGMVVRTRDGNLIQNPYLCIANRAAKQMSEMLAEFGMSPSSRTRVTATKPTEADSAKLRLINPRQAGPGAGDFPMTIDRGDE